MYEVIFEDESTKNIFFIDTISFYLLKHTFINKKANYTENHTYLSYRKFDGVIFPVKVILESGIGSQVPLSSIIEYSSIELNRLLSPSLFQCN